MKKNTMDALVRLWTSDASFREELRSNPQGAAARRGIDVDARTLAALDSLCQAGALEPRISPLNPTNQC
jgi:hypothetical protein